MTRRIVKGDHCLNCGKELHDENFCPDCGQLNNIAKPTFGQLIMDALANLFAFDSKFYLSIWPLMRYPGRLSLELVSGKKATYLPPIRLFLLVVIITLGLNSLNNRLGRGFTDTSHLRESSGQPDSFGQIARAEGKDTTDQKTDITLTFGDSDSGDKLARMFNYAAENPDSTIDKALLALNYPLNFWNRFAYSSMLKLTLMSLREFVSYIKSNLLMILLLFVPIMALVLKALYFYKREYYYVDHFVFSIHTQTAFFVFITISILVNTIVGTSGFFLVLIAFPVYLFLALRNFYKQGKLATAANYLVINITFFFVAGIFLFLVGLVSFLLI